VPFNLGLGYGSPSSINSTSGSGGGTEALGGAAAFLALYSLKGIVRGTTSTRNSRLSRDDTALAGMC
jgi:hypothetical protein